MPPIFWSRIVELARQIDDDFRVRGVVDNDIALRLVHGVVNFQEQLVGRFVRVARRATIAVGQR